MIFSFFDSVRYKGSDLADIFRNYNSYFKKASSKYIIKNYVLQGAPRPETVAYNLYNNTDLYWVLLMLNSIRDPFHGWIKTETACYESADQKYPENKVLYHVDRLGNKFYNLVEYPVGSNLWYDKGDETYSHLQYDLALKAIDIYEDSIIENERLRYIKIIDPKDINSFLSDFIRELETA